MNISDTKLNKLTYYGIIAFFVNLNSMELLFVYEKLADNSLQIYTTHYPEEFIGDLQKVFSTEGEWRVFKSIEVNTININNINNVTFIENKYPELLIKQGLI